MSIKTLKENVASRSIGYAIKETTPAQVIYQGTMLVIEKNATSLAQEVRVFDDTDIAGGLIPSGMAIDQNQQPSIAPDTNPTAGEGYDYTNYNRGGLVATFDDGTVEVYGNSLVKADDTFAVGEAVYWDGANKRYTVTSTNNYAVGVLEDYTGTNGSAVTKLKIKVKKFA